jgi:hypothetical protein
MAEDVGTNHLFGYPLAIALLPQRNDPTWAALYRFLECGSRNPVITGENNQLPQRESQRRPMTDMGDRIDVPMPLVNVRTK